MLRAPGAPRARTRLWILLTVPALACSPALRGYDVAPNGLARSDARLRSMLAVGHADSALTRLLPAERGLAPTDAVLRLLYQGTVAYYAGDYARSVSSLDSAVWLADDRTVARVSREAAALLSNDRAIPYEPDRNERLFSAYYAALGYLRMDDPTEAAVEARRISFILENLDEDLDAREAPLYGVLRYMSGVLYELAGNGIDAAVAYRNASALLPSLAEPATLTGDTGEVVLFIEDGFVAHRVQHSLTIVLGSDEHDRLHDHDRDVRRLAADELAMRVLASAFAPANEYGVGPQTGRRDWFVPAPDRPKRPRCRDASKTEAADTTRGPAPDSARAARSSRRSKPRTDCDDDDRTYILRMAWPAYHADRRPASSARILRSDSSDVAAPVFASINDAVLAQHERDRPAMLARMIARSAAKYALVKGAEDIGGDDNNGIGRLLGAIANISTAVLEQADTRSWTLLPGSIGVARIRLPEGTHDLALAVGDRLVELPGVQVKRGRVRVDAVRVW